MSRGGSSEWDKLRERARAGEFNDAVRLYGDPTPEDFAWADLDIAKKSITPDELIAAKEERKANFKKQREGMNAFQAWTHRMFSEPDAPSDDQIREQLAREKLSPSGTIRPATRSDVDYKPSKPRSTAGEEIMAQAEAGARGFSQGLLSLPQGVAQMAQAVASPVLPDEFNKQFKQRMSEIDRHYAGLREGGTGVAETIGQVVSYIAPGAALKGAAAAAGAVGQISSARSMAHMAQAVEKFGLIAQAVPSSVSTYEQLVKDGVVKDSYWNAIAFPMGMAAIEGVSEKIGLDLVGKVATNKILKVGKLMGGGYVTAAARELTKALVSAGIEGTEEVVSQVMQNGYQNLYGANTPLLEGAKESFLMGAAAGGPVSVGMSVAHGVERADRASRVNEFRQKQKDFRESRDLALEVGRGIREEINTTPVQAEPRDTAPKIVEPEKPTKKLEKPRARPRKQAPVLSFDQAKGEGYSKGEMWDIATDYNEAADLVQEANRHPTDPNEYAVVRSIDGKYGIWQKPRPEKKKKSDVATFMDQLRGPEVVTEKAPPLEGQVDTQPQGEAAASTNMKEPTDGKEEGHQEGRLLNAATGETTAAPQGSAVDSPASIDDNSSAEEVRQNWENRQRSLSGDPNAKVEIVDESKDSDAKRIANAVRKRGAKPFVFRTKFPNGSPNMRQGLAFGSRGVGVDMSSQESVRSVIAHETLHSLQRRHEDGDASAGEVRSKIVAAIGPDAISRARADYIARYAKSNPGAKLDGKRMQREAEAHALGMIVDGPPGPNASLGERAVHRLLRQRFGEDPKGFIEKVKSAISSGLNAMGFLEKSKHKELLDAVDRWEKWAKNSGSETGTVDDGATDEAIWRGERYPEEYLISTHDGAVDNKTPVDFYIVKPNGEIEVKRGTGRDTHSKLFKNSGATQAEGRVLVGEGFGTATFDRVVQRFPDRVRRLIQKQFPDVTEWVDPSMPYEGEDIDESVGDGKDRDAASAASDAGGRRMKKGPDGRYIGGPWWAKSPAHIAKMRRRLDVFTEYGKLGRFWYENSGREVLRICGIDPDSDRSGWTKEKLKEAEILCALIAVYSPGNSVDPNFAAAIKARTQWETGVPIKAGRRADHDVKAARVMRGHRWSGIKTNNFYVNLMRFIDPSLRQGVTADIWVARGLGYETDAISSEAQYGFASSELNLKTKRLGGDWEPWQVQASMWTGIKDAWEEVWKPFSDKAKKVGDATLNPRDNTLQWKSAEIRQKYYMEAWDKAFEYASEKVAKGEFAEPYDFAHASNRRIAGVYIETIPSTTVTDLLPNLHKATLAEKIEVHRAVFSAFDITEAGRLLGLVMPNPITENKGYWDGASNPVALMQSIISRDSERNAAVQFAYERMRDGVPVTAQEALDYSKKAGKAMLPLEQRTSFNQLAAFGGLLYGQDAVGWMYRWTKENFPSLNIPTSNGILFKDTGAISYEQATAIGSQIEKRLGTKFFAINDDGNQFSITNFSDVPNVMFQDVATEVVSEVLTDYDVPGRDTPLFKSDGDLISNDWKESPNGEAYQKALGSGLGLQLRSILREAAPLVQRAYAQFEGRYGGNSQAFFDRIIAYSDSAPATAPQAGQVDADLRKKAIDLVSQVIPPAKTDPPADVVTAENRGGLSSRDAEEKLYRIKWEAKNARRAAKGQEPVPYDFQFSQKIFEKDEKNDSDGSGDESVSYRKDDSPAFRKWFRGSKVVDENGRPLVVYHGTPKGGFRSFSSNALGSNTGAKSAGMAFFFSDSPDVSNSYTERAEALSDAEEFEISAMQRLGQSRGKLENQLHYAENMEVNAVKNDDGTWSFSVTALDDYGSPYNIDGSETYESKAEALDAGDAYKQEEIDGISRKIDALDEKRRQEMENEKVGAASYPVYLSMKNPLEHDFGGRNYRDVTFAELMERAKSRGHDGVILTNVYDQYRGSAEPSTVYAVFDPEQIKSATGNRGTFSKDSPNIDESISSPEFKQWFGNSVVKDADGRPITVYHGTSVNKDFRKFKNMKSGIWFTTNTDEAGVYSRSNRMQESNDSHDASRIIPAYIKIERPYVPTNEEQDRLAGPSYERAQKDIFELARARGYDGIVGADVRGMGKGTYVVFDPKNVKSALGNSGQYSTSSANIDEYIWTKPEEAANAMVSKVLTTTGTAIGNQVKGLIGAASRTAASPFIDAAKAALRKIGLQVVPDHLLMREWVAARREAEMESRFGKSLAAAYGHLLHYGGESKMLGFEIDKQWMAQAKNRKLFNDVLLGDQPTTALPAEYQPIATKIRMELDDLGQKAVNAGYLTQETFDVHKGKYLPRLYLPRELERRGLMGAVARLRMNNERRKPRLSDAYAILRSDGSPVDGPSGSFRFNSAVERDQYLDAMIADQTVSEVNSIIRGSRQRVTLADLAPAAIAAHPAPLRQVIQNTRAEVASRYTKNDPKDAATLAAMGLIEEPSYPVGVAMLQLRHDLAMKKFFAAMAANPAISSDVETTQFNKQVPQSPKFGALSGKWLPEELHTDLNNLTDAPGVAMQFYREILTAWKTGKTVLNPATHGRNFLGNWMFADLANVGVHDPRNWKYYTEAARIMSGVRGPVVLQRLNQLGVIGNEFATEELSGVLGEIGLDLNTSNPTNPMKWLWKMAKKGVKGAGTVYNAIDVVFKLAAFAKAKHSGLNDKESAELVKKWFPDYSRVPRTGLIRGIKDFVFPFLSFQYEAVRIGAAAAATKPITLAKWAAVPYLITQISMMALGLDDDDEKNISEELKGGGLFSILLPFRDSKNRLLQWDLSNVIPIAGLTGMRTESNPLEDKTLIESLVGGAITGNPLVNLAVSLGMNQDPFTRRKIYQSGMTTGEKAGATFDQVRKMAQPGFVNAIETNIRAGKTQRSTLDKRDRLTTAIRTTVGVDVKSADPMIRRMVDQYLKRHNLPVGSVAMSDTSPRSRASGEMYQALLDSDQDAFEEALATMERVGAKPVTFSDLKKSIESRHPLSQINKAERYRFMRELTPEQKRVIETATNEFETLLPRAREMFEAVGE